MRRPQRRGFENQEVSGVDELNATVRQPVLDDPVPALLLGRFAVDRRYANLGIGIPVGETPVSAQEFEELFGRIPSDGEG